MQGLRKHAGNYAQALHQVPRNNRHLYVHAYQSFLWNSAATHRVKTYGIAGAVAGDLVISSGTGCGALSTSTFASCSLKTLSLANMSRVGMHGITNLIASIGCLRFGHVILAA